MTDGRCVFFCVLVGHITKATWPTQGTPFFIPIEADSMKYHFLPPRTPRDESSTSLSAFLRGHDTSSPTSPTEATTLDNPLFTANPLHDLESLWWLAVYLTLPRRVVRDRLLVNEETQAKNEQWAIELFTEPASRAATMLGTSHFSDGIQTFHPVMKFMATHLETARTQLVDAYHRAELKCRSTGIDAAATMSAHTHFEKAFEAIRKDLMAVDFQLSEISINYLRKSTGVETAKPAGGSLDPRRLLRNPGKHRRDSDDSDDGLQKITRGLNVLASPSREAQLRRSKRLRKREPSPLPLAASGAGERSGSKSRVEVEDTKGGGTDDGSGSDE